MLFTDFNIYIPKLQKANLGGIKAQFRLAPTYRKKFEEEKITASNPTLASVMIIFFPDKKGKTSFILTKRANYKGHHAKQISFPGGKKEAKDADLIETAIRETQEEIGVTIPKEKVFKQLTEVYIPPSNFLAFPFVCYLKETPNFILNHEVTSIHICSLEQLFDTNNIQFKEIETNSGQKIKTPCFVFNNQIVWGATAMMLSELKELFISVLPK